MNLSHFVFPIFDTIVAAPSYHTLLRQLRGIRVASESEELPDRSDGCVGFLHCERPPLVHCLGDDASMVVLGICSPSAHHLPSQVERM